MKTSNETKAKNQNEVIRFLKGEKERNDYLSNTAQGMLWHGRRSQCGVYRAVLSAKIQTNALKLTGRNSTVF